MTRMAAIVAAVAVNALLVMAIVALNRTPPRAAQADAPILLARHVIPENEAGPEQPREEPAAPRDVTPAAAVPPPLGEVAPPPAPLPALDIPLAIDLASVRVAVPPVARPAPASALASRLGPGAGAPDAGTGEPASDGAVDEPARWDPANQEPDYPRGLRRRGVEGEVTVKMLIDERGRVAKVWLLSVVGPASFGDEVLDVASSWRFTPARHQGRAVAVYARKTVAFRMAGR